MSTSQSIEQTASESINESLNQSVNPVEENESWKANIDEREVWLKIWNSSTDPAKVSCVTAFDILYYCYSPANQLRALYRTNAPANCDRQRDDVQLCADVMLKKITGNAAVDALRASRDHFIVREPHVWEFREQPLQQWRRSANNSITQSTSQSTDQSNTDTTKQSYSELIRARNQSLESAKQPKEQPAFQTEQSIDQADACRSGSQPNTQCQSISSKVQNFVTKVWRHSTGTS